MRTATSVLYHTREGSPLNHSVVRTCAKNTRGRGKKRHEKAAKMKNITSPSWRYFSVNLQQRFRAIVHEIYFSSTCREDAELCTASRGFFARDHQPSLAISYSRLFCTHSSCNSRATIHDKLVLPNTQLPSRWDRVKSFRILFILSLLIARDFAPPFHATMQIAFHSIKRKVEYSSDHSIFCVVNNDPGDWLLEK